MVEGRHDTEEHFILNFKNFNYISNFIVASYISIGLEVRMKPNHSENPYSGFMARPDWPLLEAIDLHFTRLQQVKHFITIY